jgi:hypothetical protein
MNVESPSSRVSMSARGGKVPLENCCLLFVRAGQCACMPISPHRAGCAIIQSLSLPLHLNVCVVCFIYTQDSTSNLKTADFCVSQGVFRAVVLFLHAVNCNS